MRVTVGAVAVLGLAVTVAAAQPGKERAAALKAPEPVAPGELPVARGVADDFPPPPPLSSTPVPRSTGPAARAATSAGPAWLTGADPNVRPAAGTAIKTGDVRPLTPPPAALVKDDPIPPPPKLLDRIRGLPGDKAPAQPVAPPKSAQPPQPPTASTPFRGTGANGAPVYAGPPAYRWYGWGSVTPGANPLAPSGQYPKASANWYSITGATPGAFPVPVSEPVRVAPGTEPPTYGLAARQPVPPPVVPFATQPPPAPPGFVERTEAPKFHPQPESKFLPGPSVGALPPPAVPLPPGAPAGVPVLAPPPIPKPAAVAAPAVLPPPSMPLPPTLPAPTAPAAVTVAPAVPVAPPAPPAPPKADPVAALPVPPVPVPALPPALPAPSVAPAPAVLPLPPVEPIKAAVAPTTPPAKPIGAAPAALPTSVTADPPRDEPKWQQSSEPAVSRPGAWAPAKDAKPLPTVPVGPLPAQPGWQSGSANVKPVTVRGQMPDNTPNPIDTLIKQMCQGRAEGVEIRWTGTKKLQVCFEIRTAESAQKLVADISKRPELTAYQIDFCVVVK